MQEIYLLLFCYTVHIEYFCHVILVSLNEKSMHALLQHCKLPPATFFQIMSSKYHAYILGFSGFLVGIWVTELGFTIAKSY